MEAGGLTFNDKDELVVTTRRGEVWVISDPDKSTPVLNRFAHGLHEPLGISYGNDAYFITHRGELLKIEDQNDDGIADLYKTIYDWPLSGNYHEYSYGPKFLPNGEMLVTLNLSWIGYGSSLEKWRGWMLKITEDGEMIPFATGLRSPIGFGFNADGDIFYSENQGDWIGSGWITHLEEGDFAGNPEGLKWSQLPGSPIDLTYEEFRDEDAETMYEHAKIVPELKLPAVWFPHGIMGISTSDILLIENNNQVGPFKDQLLVGDQGHSMINRVFLEKVNGAYQGVVFRFREGFSSGVIKLAWGPDDILFVGMTNRGWSSTGQEPYGIDRLKWNGNIPFEIHSIQAESNGFTINFTEPVNETTAVNTNSYSVTDFTYLYHSKYGSPIVDRETKNIVRAEVAEDGRSVRLFVENLREGYINEIKTDGVTASESGNPLLHSVGYYTLNNLPEGERLVRSNEGGTGYTGGEANATGKNMTTQPADWGNGPDQTLNLGTNPGLQFDKETLTVKAGSKVALNFTNSDDMLHNVLIVNPGTVDEVGNQAMQLGLDGPDMDYVPISDDVLFHTSLLQPNEEETIYFEVPDEPGEYQFVCTFPGHYITMRGIFRVTE